MMQNTTKKHWPNFDQLKKELDDISYKGNKTTGFGSEGRYAKPGSNRLPWKKTP